jgi:hypothetical protein
VVQVSIYGTTVRVETQSTLATRLVLSSISGRRSRKRLSDNRGLQSSLMRLSSVLSSHTMAIDLILDGAVVSDSSVQRLSIVSY